MDRIPPILLVLEGQDVPVTLQNVRGILLQESHKAQLELLVAPDCVGVVLDGVVELPVFDVHGFHAVAHFLLAQLVVHNFFQAHALIVE